MPLRASCCMADYRLPERKRRKSTASVNIEHEEEIGGSQLREWLLTEYAWGRLSPQQVQKVAQLAVADAGSRKLRDLQPLAALGSQGGARSANFLCVFSRASTSPGHIVLAACICVYKTHRCSRRQCQP